MQNIIDISFVLVLLGYELLLFTFISMIRTLIIYGTRKGTTETTAQVLAETLILKHKHSVELANIKKIRKYKKRLDEFQTIIVGSSIVYGRWKQSVLRFLKKYDFQNQHVALFVTAGATMNKEKEYGMSREEVRNEAIKNYIDVYRPEFLFTPIAETAFGGMVIRSGKEKFNSWNREDIESWAIHLGNIILKKAK